MQLVRERQDLLPEWCRHVAVEGFPTKSQEVQPIGIPATGYGIEGLFSRPRAASEKSLARSHIGREAVGMVADRELDDADLIIRE